MFRPWRHVPLLALLLYVALSLVKMRAYALHGRFWAEEGAQFLPAMDGADLLDVLSFAFHGHLELWTNLVVRAAAAVDLLHAPQVSTWLSYVLQGLPVALVAALHRELGLKPPALLAWIIVIVGLPQAAEVWANSINLHFHFALLAAIVAAVEAPSLAWARTLRVLLLAAGLSGIPANFLVPVFVWLAVRGGRERRIQAAILCGTAALQLAVLASQAFAVGERHLPTDPLLYVFTLTSQQVFAPLLGRGAGGALAGQLRALSQHGGAAAIAAGLACACLLALCAVAVRRARDARLAILSASALLLGALSIATALGQPEALVSTTTGGRYFFASAALGTIVLLRLAQDRSALLARGLATLSVLVAATGVPAYLGGPSWPDALAQSAQAPGSPVAIWPSGWTLPRP